MQQALNSKKKFMKILIEDVEKNSILEMHSKMKKNKVVLEQVQPEIDAQLQAFVDDGRAVGIVVPMNSTNPQLKFAIKQESTKTPGKFRYLFIDKRVGMIENGKFIFVKDAVWSPGPAKQKVDPKAEDMKTDSGREVATGSWTDRKDINIPDSELVQTYEQHPKHKNLWKKKATVNKSSGFTEDQQAFIDAWMGSTPDIEEKVKEKAYKFNPTAADFATGQWTRDNYFIAPGSEPYFPADEKGKKGLKIFINVNKLDKEPNRENCRAAIKTFVNMFKQAQGGKQPEAQVFANTKALVKLCKATMKFGGPFSKVDDDLNFLAGQTVDGYKGPPARDSQNNPHPFRID
jgi:hypothetical protein